MSANEILNKEHDYLSAAKQNNQSITLKECTDVNE